MEKIEFILSNDDFFEIYSDMLTQFPKCEMKSKKQFSELLKNPDYCAYSIRISGIKAGYVILFKDKINKTLWMDYIAIFKKHQSKGFGTKIFETMKKTFSEFSGMWIEVEKPDNNRQETFKRIKFYKKIGAKLINENYIYPNRENGLAMDLYFLPYCPNNTICTEKMNKCIKNVFETLHYDVKDCDLIFEKIKKRSQR